MKIENEIRDYISETILNGVEIKNDTKLYNSISSLAHLKLINFLERKYDVVLNTHEINFETFNTVSKIAERIKEMINVWIEVIDF